MNILMHADPRTQEPLGVWSIPEAEGSPTPHYIDASAEQAGRDRLDLFIGEGDWRERAQDLAMSTPYSAWWEIADVAATDLADALEQLRRQWAGTSAPTGSTRFEAAARRVRFTNGDASELAQLLLGADHRPYAPGVRLSRTIVVRRSADDGRLAVMVAPGEAASHIDAALAFGLTFQGDRDLLLVLPDETRSDGEPVVDATLRRLAFVVTPVRAWTYDATMQLTEHVVPAKVEAEAATRVDEQLPLDTHDLGDRAAWVAPLVAACDADAALDAAHRLSYLAWHSAGRQVLRIERTRTGLRLTAGVNYSPHRTDVEPPTVIDLAAPITSYEHKDIEVAVQNAVDNRAAGEDAQNLEHLLQAAFATDVGVSALGLAAKPLREVPASRPGQRRAYIDLLGVDASGDLHLSETKLGLDPMLGIQALDYWVWLTHHRDELVDHLRSLGAPVGDDPKIRLDIVVGERDGVSRPDLRYLAPVLEALDGAVSWRVGVVTGWLDPDTELTVEWTPRRRCPQVPSRIEPPRFAHHLGDHLVEWAERFGHSTGRVWLADVHRATVPPARPALTDLVSRGLAHRFLSHVRSSQLFAINLFGGLSAEQTIALARRIDPTVVAADRPVLEYSDPADRLAEATHASPHATQVDVLIRATTGDGVRHALLIEVKLTEDDFGGCSAYQSPDNDRRDVCRTSLPFGGDTDACFQLRNHDREHRRRYDTYMPAAGGTGSAAVGCPFRTGGNQVMRNLALAGLLVAEGEADRATVVLCAHDDHQVAWRRWHDLSAQIARPDGVEVAPLLASDVLQEHDPDQAAALSERYRLPRAVWSDPDDR